MSGSLFQAYADRDACVAGLAIELAECLRQAQSGGARARLLLPGGTSPQALLPHLARRSLDWSRLDLSPGDERWVPRDDPQSNYRLLQQGLPAAACLDPRQAPAAEQAVQLWGERLREWLPFSAVLLGVGEDGHIASLFPGMLELAAALDIDATPATLLVHTDTEPRLRLSANLALLLNTGWLGLLVFGERKKRLIYAALAGQPATRELPLHALLHNGRRAVHIHWAP